eukprot:TRINITY_DN405_c0_g1_i5.p1 TRINITY_DN405_c0_g1~~TRINITY_DN405_c0_g1_i5.p1  ORF type:complete len:932 (-),score=246.30 TRINITY_DN405_c0_g1_i5:34-2649(-)
MPKFNKAPKISVQYMENINAALGFLSKEESIKLVNIGNADLIEGNLKIILGLVWSLILKYQISKGVKGGDGGAKSELLRWVQSKIPEHNIKGFTADWNSGAALCALANAVFPGAVTVEDDAAPLAKAGQAIEASKTKMSIPPLMDAEDITNPGIDELSMMTFVDLFRQFELAKLAGESAAPAPAPEPVPEPAPAPVADPIIEGPGVQSGAVAAGSPAEFKVVRNGKTGDLAVTVQGPDADSLSGAPAITDNGDGSASVVYNPTKPGAYTVAVALGGEPVKGSPFSVFVSGDAVAEGPGVQSGAVAAGSPAEFKVVRNGKTGDLAVTVQGPDADSLSGAPAITDNGDGSASVVYNPTKPGAYTVAVALGGEPVKGSPFSVFVSGDAVAEGPGVQSGAVAAGSPAEFKVVRNGKTGDLAVTVQGPDADSLSGAPAITDNGDGSASVVYNPTKPGAYTVAVALGGEPVKGSPFSVQILPDPTVKKQQGFSTRMVHAGISPDPTTGAINVPIYVTTTYVQESVDKYMSKGYSYSRAGNPTVRALEKKIAALEEGFDGVCFATGMAATTAVFTALTSAGDHVVCSDVVYGGTYRYLVRILSRFGVESTFVDTSNAENVRAALRPNTKIVWTESPANPTLKLTDLQAVSEITKERGILHVCDNTFLTPYFQRPLGLGADIVVHSTTKYFDGHNQTVGGAVVCKTEELDKQVRFVMKATGTIMAPQVAFIQLQGTKTLSMRMERQASNALAIARYLQTHPAVNQVVYPGLPSFPQHELALRQASGFGAMIWFEIKGGVDAGKKFMDNVTLWSLGENLGSVESLVTHPVTMTHSDMPREERLRAGILDGLVRLSVGAEDSDDLIDALRVALDAAAPLAK